MNFKKIYAYALAALVSLTGVAASAQSLSPSTKWHWDKGTIVIDSPARPAGQQHALGLKVAPIKTVRVAFVGLDSVKVIAEGEDITVLGQVLIKLRIEKP